MPAAGIALFLLLFLIAAALYPGGHQADPTGPGFSLLWNYWSDLLRGAAVNGEPNPAQPIALAGLFALVLSISTFWCLIPALFPDLPQAAHAVRAAGPVGALLTLLVFTPLHDLVIGASALLELSAMLVTLRCAHQRGERTVAASGAATLALAFATLAVWKTDALPGALPVAQKAAALAVFAWVIVASERARNAP